MEQYPISLSEMQVLVTLRNHHLQFQTIIPTANPELSGVGNFDMGEVVQGLTSGIEARVKSWDTDTKILEISNVGIGTTMEAFVPVKLYKQLNHSTSI